ncbi:small ubiquitin-related modifier 3 [Patella vulgata]|uniref:Small ubiquitin-related modifier n=1 Tax=Patella caerulea TaxID=87958 RepID=A0AAN8PEN6_PATCE|nr:small ubiquitin-related modifier 3 [Patella vulgata]
MSDEKKVNDEKCGNEHINLKVTGQDGSVVHFKIKKNTPLRKLMSAYCNRAGITVGAVRFRFDGNPMDDDDTPLSMDMEDGDSIDVFQQQTGGLCT